MTVLAQQRKRERERKRERKRERAGQRHRKKEMPFAPNPSYAGLPPFRPQGTLEESEERGLRLDGEKRGGGV